MYFRNLRNVLTALALLAGVQVVSAQTDITKQYLTNANFESGTDGWTVAGLSTQTNSYFTKKNGTTYLETWVDRGRSIGNAGVSQLVKALPKGKYRLRASGLHIQQRAANSDVNINATPQTGAWLYADVYQTAVHKSAVYNLEFAVLEEQADVKVGARVADATGNWFCIDNFQLFYLGETDIEAYVQYLQSLQQQANAYLAAGVQNEVRAEVDAAVQAAQAACSASPLSQEQLEAAVTGMKEAIAKAEASNARYENLREAIAYATKVLGWWEGISRKANAWNRLSEGVADAQEKLTNYDLTDAELKSAATILSARTKAVDKKIYESGNAVGTGTALNNTNSQWCYQRSLQSKHWILFWEKGYGDGVPAGVEEILATADRIFEFYADSLKFIVTNKGTSKTDTYKMIIRLRSTTEWEASGSGIDNTIGLLTLSRWAYTSRGGQTVAHEIGHCFQYQTHCDNNDWNGWMYNWGSSTLNVFWEMCAQWQAYKFYPDMQTDNEWLNNSLNGMHRHPLCVELRYENFFIQDYMADRHGMDIIGQLWNKSRSPEDPLQAYMRLTMKGTTAAKLEQLGDEMWEYGARMTTFDMDHMRTRFKGLIGRRAQPQLTKDAQDFWWPTAASCIENWGNNAIRLNVPATAKTIYVEFEGKAGASGYTELNKTRAGWRIGFVALKKDGTRIYSDITPASYAEPNATVAFDCPAGCSYVWLVVSGAPTLYWTRDWLSWSESSKAEQWPYRVKLHQTNIYGKANNNTYPTGIDGIMADAGTPAPVEGVYTLGGTRLRQGTSLDGLPRGIYVVNGRKVVKK